MALVILSKNTLSPPTISIFALFNASPTIRACCSAMSFVTLICASSISLSLFRFSLNSSCSRPTPSKIFMASAFSVIPLASAWNFISITLASAVPSFSLASAFAEITCAWAKPAAASSALIPDASLFFAAANLEAAFSSESAAIIISSAFISAASLDPSAASTCLYFSCSA